MAIIYTTKGDPVTVDDDMADMLSLIAWRLDKNGYAVGARPKRYGGGTLYMHRLIVVPKDGQEIDHIDGDRSNNLRSNLRSCTHSQNCANRGRDRKNTSGFKGVNWDGARGKWLARIKHEGRQLNLGRFESAESAYAAYCTHAAMLKGEFVNYG